MVDVTIESISCRTWARKTLCSGMGRRAQYEALVKGEGFRMALSFGKLVCKACLKKLPIQEQAEVDAIQERGAGVAE